MAGGAQGAPAQPGPQPQEEGGDEDTEDAGPERAKTRMAGPVTTPGRVRKTRHRASPPRRAPVRRWRHRTPCPATTLNNRFVGVTAGLGAPGTPI